MISLEYYDFKVFGLPDSFQIIQIIEQERCTNRSEIVQEPY